MAATPVKKGSPPAKSVCNKSSPSPNKSKKSSARSTIFDQGSSYEVEPGVRASLLCKRTEGALIGTVPGCQTFWETFKRGLATSPTGNCLGWRVGDIYAWWTYEEVNDIVRRVAGALIKNTQLKRQDRVGIYSGTNPNWIIAALAISSRSLTFVPLYNSLGIDCCSYILNQTEMPLIFVDTPGAARQVIANARHTPSLLSVVMFEEPDQDLMNLADEHGVVLSTLEQFIALSSDTPFEAAFNDEPKAGDICAIFYTSGTTGEPKGVIHTHESVVVDFTAINNSFFLNDFGPGIRFSKDDVGLQYLPLAHTYGLLMVNWLFFHGSSIAFFGGNIAKLIEDAAIVKPTFFPLVPRLMNRLYSKVTSEVQKSVIKSKLFWYAYRRKRELMFQGHITRDSLWDKLVFKKIQALLGGRCWLMCVGSAPVSAEVVEFWRVVFGVLILEGYGQTETAAAATVAMGPLGGNVGHPLCCNYIKLVDVPECSYYVEEGGRGEVCIKGINVMRGYFKQPDKTAEVVDADGWLHTGDIGEFLDDGSLRIVDRKKNIFKLAQGEYIAPEKVENVYLLCTEIIQVFVEGSSLESYTVAVVVLEPTAAEAYAERNGIDAKLVHLNEGYRKFLLQSLRGVGKANKLNSLEQVRSIHVTNEPFSIENGLLTPTMKNKRPELRKYFKEQIEALYKAGPTIGFDSRE